MQKVESILTAEFIHQLSDSNILRAIFRYYRAKSNYEESRKFNRTKPLVLSAYRLEEVGMGSSDTSWVKRKFGSYEDIIKRQSQGDDYRSKRKTALGWARQDLVKALEEGGYL